jgi:hypothetical protein
MDIFKMDKKENNNNLKNNNNISQDISNISNIKNDSVKESEFNDKQNIDIASIRQDVKHQEQKKLESFEINLLQTQRKKEYENFQKQQVDKINSLKENWKK